MIKLLMAKNCEVVFDRTANKTATIEEICAFAENAFFSGSVDYIRISIDGETYMELES